MNFWPFKKAKPITPVAGTQYLAEFGSGIRACTVHAVSPSGRYYSTTDWQGNWMDVAKYPLIEELES